MESLLLDGKKFVKAKELAMKLGYTADYVGQLCRGGKIDAKLVGRTWYVDETALVDHKEHRQRSSKKVQQRVVEKEIASLNTEHFKPSFYRRLHPEVAYLEDETDLMPQPKKHSGGADEKVSGTVLSVQLADATEVAVTPKAGEYLFTEIARPEPIFKGDVVIKSVDEDYKERELFDKKLSIEAGPEEIAVIDSDTTEYAVAVRIDKAAPHKPGTSPETTEANTRGNKRPKTKDTNNLRHIKIESADGEEKIQIKTRDKRDFVQTMASQRDLTTSKVSLRAYRSRQRIQTPSMAIGRIAVVAAVFVATFIMTLTLIAETSISASQAASLQVYEIDLFRLQTEIKTLINMVISD